MRRLRGRRPPSSGSEVSLVAPRRHGLCLLPLSFSWPSPPGLLPSRPHCILRKLLLPGRQWEKVQAPVTGAPHQAPPSSCLISHCSVPTHTPAFSSLSLRPPAHTCPFHCGLKICLSLRDPDQGTQQVFNERIGPQRWLAPTPFQEALPDLSSRAGSGVPSEFSNHSGISLPEGS